MDVEMLVERLKVLATAEVDGIGVPDAVRRLLNSPAVQTLATASILARLPMGEPSNRWALRDFLTTVPMRAADDVELCETEIDPDVLYTLEQAGVHTLGQARRMSDEQLLAIPKISYARVEEVRAITGKYLRIHGQVLQSERGPKAGRQASVERRVLEAIEAGWDDGEICRRLKLPGPLVRKVRAGWGGETSGVRLQTSGQSGETKKAGKSREIASERQRGFLDDADGGER